MSNPNLRVKVYGARGSYSPTRGIASQIGVNTTCLRVDFAEHILVFDAGSGIINCGTDLMEMFKSRKQHHHRDVIHLFFTHMHFDHLLGFPYFAPLYSANSQIHFLSPKILDTRLADLLQRFVHPPLFPVSLDDLPFEAHFYDIKENRTVYFLEDHFEILSAGDGAGDDWLVKISCLRNYMHPKGGSFFYRIENRAGHALVFASDTEGLVGGDQRLIEFSRGADVLIHDAQYSPDEYRSYQGFGHSTYEMACDIARQAAVKKLLLFHHDPRNDDQKLQELEAQARKLFPETSMAADSMEFTL